MRAKPGTSVPLIAAAVLHPEDAARSTSLQAVSAGLARTLILIVVAMTGILILLPAAVGAAAIHALVP